MSPERFIELWTTPVPLKDIEAEAGTNRRYLYERARCMGLGGKVSARRRHDYDAPEFARMWRECANVAEMAEFYGVPVQTIHTAARKRGLPMRTWIKAGRA